MTSWKLCNPGVPYFKFDSTTARSFIAAHSGPELLACYDLATHPAMQSDIFRLAFLAVNGGIYADADEECRCPLDQIQAAMRHVGFIGWLVAETVSYIDNALLAAQPGCPIIAWALEDAVNRVAKAREAKAKVDIWELTSPGLLTRAVSRFLIEPNFHGRAVLLTDQEYRAFSQTQELDYKKTAEGNWRFA